MGKFDFNKWKSAAYRRGERWANSRAMRRVTQHIGDTGEQPTAAFVGMWNANSKSAAVLESAGIIVLFPDRFWLIPELDAETDLDGFKEIPWAGISSVSEIADSDEFRHAHEISLNRGNIRITTVQPSEKAEALKAFRKHIFE